MSLTVLILALILSTGFTLTVLYPLLRLHVSTYKRRIVIILALIVFLNVISLILFFSTEMLLSSFLVLIVLGIIVAISILLRRLDYYLEELLAELLVLVFGLSTVHIMVVVWDIFIDLSLPLYLMKGFVALVPLFSFALKRMYVKNFGIMHAALIYSVLIIIKLVLFRYLGLWSIILLYIYSILAGYVASWMISTSRPEQILSLNISPEKIWMSLVLIAGALVIGF